MFGLFNIFGDISNGSNIGGQGTRADGHQNAQKKSCQKRNIVIIN
jgi:hypothetical protein